MTVEMHVGAPPSAPLAEQIAFFRRAEELGFAGVGVADDPTIGVDAFVTLAVAAAQTERVWLYPAVTNPVTRHPVVLAGLAGSLSQLAPGRVKLVLATGDSGVTHAGLRPAKLATLREAASGIRLLLRGEPASFAWREGPPVEATLTNPPSSPPPVAVAASGPRTLEMAGEAADEAIVTAGLHPRIVEAVASHVAAGADRAGRDVRSVPITHYTIVSIDEDQDRAIERTRSWLHLWLKQGMYDLALRELSMDIPSYEAPGDIPRDALHELARALFIAGTPRDAAEQVERLADAGVERLFCMLPGGPKRHREGLELIGRHLLPLV